MSEKETELHSWWSTKRIAGEENEEEETTKRKRKHDTAVCATTTPLHTFIHLCSSCNMEYQQITSTKKIQLAK